MAVYAKDGSRHHSASRAKLHDESGAAAAGTGKGNKAATEPVSPMKTAGAGKAGPMHPGGHPPPTETPIGDHVAEHGPAHSMMHMLDGGTHHVSTYHGDAKMGEDDHPHAHHSQHKSHAAVHEHLGQALGVEGGAEGEPEGEESPDEANAAMPMTGGSKVPGLA